MKKLGILILVVSLMFINLISAQVRINEVELNPAGTDTGNEWIELYSDSAMNLEGWKLINHDNHAYLLNLSINGYLTISFEEQFLDNENESIMLYNGNNLVSITPVLKDSYNDDRTWNYCNSVWLFLSSSKGYANNCQTQSNNTSNNTNNQTNQTNTNPPVNNSTNNSSNSTISLSLDWDDNDIVNGDDFKITIKANNLLNKEYDIKVSIYDDDNNLISQTYDENGKWVTSNEYYNGFFLGPGSAEEDIKLRIKESYRDFKGDATIIVRIRETGTSSYKKEKQEDIEILKAKTSPNSDTDTNSDTGSEETAIAGELINSLTSNPSNSEAEKIIHLNKNIKTESIKTNKNTIYQSKNELIKTYSIYFFAFLLIIFCILLVFKR